MPAADKSDPITAIITKLARIKVDGALNLYDEAACVAVGDKPGEATFRRRILKK